MLFYLTSQCFGVYLHNTGGQNELHSFNTAFINPEKSPFSIAGTLFTQDFGKQH